MVEPMVNEYANVAFAPEAVFGTGISVGAISGWIGQLQDTQELPFPQIEHRPIYTSGHTVGGEAAGPLAATHVEGKTIYHGKLAWLVQNGQLFEQIFGKRTSTGTTPTTHTFECGIITARPLPSISLAGWNDKAGDGFTEDDDIAVRSIGGRLVRSTFTFAEGEELKADADVYALDMDNQTSFPGAFAEITTKPYLMSQGALTIFGSAFAKVLSGTFTIDHQAKEYHYGNVKTQDIVATRIKLTGSFNVIVTNDDLFELFIDRTANPTLRTRASILFTRAANDTLTLESEASGTQTEAYYNIKPKFGSGEGPVEADIELSMQNFRSVVVDAITNYPAY